jgi:anti-anti-sigma factor
MSTQPVIVRLVGDFDAYNAEELRRLLDPARDGAEVVIDFTGTRYVDSTCLTELATIRRSRLDHGLPVCRLVVPNRNMRKIFQIVGFDHVFPLFESLDEAVTPTMST